MDKEKNEQYDKQNHDKKAEFLYTNKLKESILKKAEKKDLIKVKVVDKESIVAHRRKINVKKGDNGTNETKSDDGTNRTRGKR